MMKHKIILKSGENVQYFPFSFVITSHLLLQRFLIFGSPDQNEPQSND